MKKIITGSLITITIINSMHCTQKVPVPRSIIVLVDLSSSRDAAIRQWYQWVVQSVIFPNLGRKDRITIMPVDRNSLTSSKEIASIDFASNTYGNQYAGLQAKQIEQKQHQDSVSAAAHRLDSAFAIAMRERSNFQKGTDILNALKGSKRYFLSKGQNIIVILCDMQQYSDKDSLDFERNLKTKKEIPDYLHRCEPIELSLAEIIVLTGRTNEITAQKFEALQSFWTEYFTKCQAQLIDYSSEAASVLESELRTNQ